jgi:galactokinase
MVRKMHTTLLDNANTVRHDFVRKFGGSGTICVVRAPGRVNLIGEHTDYNDGIVLPIAIEPHVLIACRARDDGKVHLASSAFEGNDAIYSLHSEITAGQPKWANYCKGVTAELLKLGKNLVGMDALIVNTLPVGSGLSSSAAILVGMGHAHLTLAGETLDGQELALLCQRAEHKYAGAPVGIMDQTIVATGREGHALMLDCRDLRKQYVPLDSSKARIVIANTMVKHELSSGEYGQRRKECESAVAYFRKSDPATKALRDVTLAQVEAAKNALGDVVYRRARHVVGEIARTQQAAKHLQAGDFVSFGELMGQSHRSLKDDYEVSCEELDFMVETAAKLPGVYGARMTGGGFGGCIVAAVKPDSADAMIDSLRSAYQKQYDIDPQIFATTATEHASSLSPGGRGPG